MAFPGAQCLPYCGKCEGGRGGEVRRGRSADSLKTKVLETQKDASGRIELTEANIIIPRGGGMKGPDEYKVLEELAKLLGAAVGASRRG
jgi:electron transfer flavoprotein alpha subunit